MCQCALSDVKIAEVDEITYLDAVSFLVEQALGCCKDRGQGDKVSEDTSDTHTHTTKSSEDSQLWANCDSPTEFRFNVLYQHTHL